ncbi:kinase [Candidatus Nitronereus thalassa]|uniref:Kinase n=1 Tax=Candidatus Nitronereus thalassa TaxID=3020898 RepID=A0ABU3K5L3_9BACT|nr:kinase [Candidatus Nitronereus thalassa]MDT7041668.1 kinase [Candidatus Nitronereus thalassa]
MIITRTPFRLSFFGGGTDYPAWYSRNEGLVIATTFSQYCYITCRRLQPFFDYKSRVVYSKMETVHEHKDIEHPAVRGCLEYLNMTSGLEVHHDADLPAKSGIGSSSTFTVGLLHALHGLKHEMPTKPQLADEAIEVEHSLLGESVGIQDQIMAAYGGLQLIEMGPSCGEKKYRVSPFILPPEYLINLEKFILLGFTGLTRFASEIAGEQIQKMEAGEVNLEELFSITKEALSLLQNNADLEKLGRLLHQSWLLKRSLTNKVSNHLIDSLYKTGLKAGAFGGKLLGAGGGGFMMFFAPPERHNRIKEALPQIRVWVPFRMETQGAQVVFHNEDY